MKLNSHLVACVILLALCIADAQTATAQRDRVYDLDGKNVSGKVTEVTAQGVVLEKSGKPQAMKAGEIQKIMFEGDPAGLTLGREKAINGNYEQAIEELKKIDFKQIERDVITADAVFTCRCAKRN